jgi:hypothetical protein
MNKKTPRSVAGKQLPHQVVVIDVLEQQMLDLQALRKKVAEAERRRQVRKDTE